MSQKINKIDLGIRIITLGSIAIAISTFVKQNNPQADTLLFILSGIFFLISGSVYMIANLFFTDERGATSNGTEKRTNEPTHFLTLIFRDSNFIFSFLRIFCVIFLVVGVAMFYVASTNLFDMFGNLRSLPTHLYWIFISITIATFILCIVQPKIYRDI